MSAGQNLIQEVVVPFLEDVRLSYEARDDRVTLELVNESYKYRVEVIGHENIRTLLVVYRGLAYTHRRDKDLLDGLNGLNCRCPGKWIPYPNGEIVYILDVVSGNIEFSPALFKQYFDAAFCVVASLYEPLQRMVYAGMSADEAIKYDRPSKQKKKSKVDRQVDSILKKALAKDEGDEEES